MEQQFYEDIDEDFIRKEAGKISKEEVSEVLDSRSKIEKKLRNTRMLDKYAQLGKLMIGMLNDYRKGTYKNVPWFTIGAMAFTLLYILNPLDLIPDFIPVLGYIDDLSVLTLTLNLVQTDLHHYLNWKTHPEDSEEEEEDV